jgi:hypothetical protein
MEVEKFTFLKVYADSIKKLAEWDEQLAMRLSWKIIQYWIYWIEWNSDDPIIEALFIQMKPMIDKWKEISIQNSENWKQWWRWRNQNKSETKAKQNQTETEIEAKQSNIEHITYNIEQRTNNIEQELIQKEDMCNKLHDDVSFERFWNLYPNKKDKKKSKQKFDRLSLIKKQLAIDWILKLKDSEQWKKWFIPLPTTYLNWERREDEVENSNSRMKQIQDYQRQARLEEAKKLLIHDDNWHETNDENSTFNRRTEMNSS